MRGLIGVGLLDVFVWWQVPSLNQLCLDLLIQHVDTIESLGCVTTQVHPLPQWCSMSSPRCPFTL